MLILNCSCEENKDHDELENDDARSDDDRFRKSPVFEDENAGGNDVKCT